MFKSKEMTPTEKKAWLEERRTGICGTDVAAILGLDPYKTPVMVWQDKHGLLPELPQNEAMRQGIDFEEYIAQRFVEETGKEVTTFGHNVGNPKYPWALCNPDRWVVHENAGLECKFTSALNYSKFKNGEYPTRYYTQCVHSIAVLEADYWYLAVLVACKEFKRFTIEREQKEIDTLMDFEKEFYEKHLKNKNMPAPDGKELTTKALTAMFLDTETSSIKDFPELLVECERFRNLELEIKELERLREKIKQNIILQIKDTEKASVGTDFTIYFKTRESNLFNKNKLLEKYPEIYKDEELWETKRSRPFLFKSSTTG